MTTIADHILQRYPATWQKPYAARLTNACEAFVESGLADGKFVVELTSGADSKFWSCVSEALLAQHLNTKIFPVRPKVGHGPDLLVLNGTQKVWIEVICPEPSGLPDSWINIQPQSAGHFPHEEILLRWTAAIKEKAEKLLGSPDGGLPGYLAKGVVAAADAYVIAVNGCRLRHGPFSALHGISQFPFAAEAVFPIGPYQVRINRETLAVAERGHQVRFNVKKANGALVPTSMFLDMRFAPVSAILAIELDGSSAIGNRERIGVIHNPLARNPVPPSFFNADEEYVAVANGDEYIFSKLQADDAVIA